MIEVQTPRNATERLREKALERARDPKVVYGLPWGYDTLDKQTHGIQKTEMTVLIARAGMGKSAFAGKIIQSVANYIRRKGINKVVRLVTLEMTSDMWLHRLACSRAEVSSEAIDTGFASQQDREKYFHELDEQDKLPIEIIDKVDSLNHLEAFIKMNSFVPDDKRTGKEPSNCAFWVVDHVGLVKGQDFGDRFGSINDASECFRILSRDVAPSLILSQMNKNCESRTDKRPNLGDVYGSDKLVHDARKVIGLYRDDFYNKLSDDERKKILPAEVHIMKSNNGRLGLLDFTFHGPTLDWRDDLI